MLENVYEPCNTLPPCVAVDYVDPLPFQCLYVRFYLLSSPMLGINKNVYLIIQKGKAQLQGWAFLSWSIFICLFFIVYAYLFLEVFRQVT